jgi:hypothetical protein
MILLFSSCQEYKKALDFSQREVIIRNEELTTTANIYVGEKQHKTKDQQVYAWFANSSILNTRGAYSGYPLDGDYQVALPTKQLKTKGAYRLGLKQGKWLHWNDYGALESSYHYKKGQLQGSYKLFYPDGSIKESGFYARGKLHGRIIKYENGIVMEDKVFKNGVDQTQKQILSEKLKQLEKDQKARKKTYKQGNTEEGADQSDDSILKAGQ